MDQFPVSASSFAASYIQTMPSAKALEEFESKEEYLEYLQKRRELYFREYLRTSKYAESEIQKLKSES